MEKEQVKKKKKMKKGVKRLIIIVLVLILIGLIALYLVNNFSAKKVKNSVKVIDEISEYGYTLDDNETKLYKDLFAKLSKVLKKDEVDKKEYAELVCELFVADFYNLDNKVTKNDIGGTQFIHSEAVENFTLKAKDTMYNGVESNVYNDRKQNLPVVTDVTLDEVNETKFKYGEEEVDAYSVSLKWKYEKDLGYETKKIFTLIKEKDNDKKLSIVQMNDEETQTESTKK